MTTAIILMMTRIVVVTERTSETCNLAQLKNIDTYFISIFTFTVKVRATTETCNVHKKTFNDNILLRLSVG